MKKITLLPPVLMLVITFLTAWQLKNVTVLLTKPVKVSNDSTVQEKDILPQVLNLNNAKYIPKKDFRKGVVTGSRIDNYLTKTSDGYYIQLPSSTNIPTPAVVNGTVYVSGGFGSRQYYAFDAVTGKNKWAVNLDDDGPSSPAIANNVMVFNTESCTIFACDMVTGKQLWSYFLGDPLMSMPTIANGIVFTAYPASYPGPVVNTQEQKTDAITIRPSHVLIAIELKTGKILWQKWIDSDVMSAKEK